MTPFLDNRETTGRSTSSPAAQQIAHNQRRLKRQAFLRRENLRLADRLEGELAFRQANDEQHPRIVKLIGNLRGCSSRGLFRMFAADGAINYVGAHTCKNKLCAICNSERKRKIRGKYYRFFESNPELRQAHDFMHLTLTVPHGPDGWQGKRVYTTEIGRAFNVMRKAAWWKELVYGGEMSIEFTKRDNGLHIHIHALLLVHKRQGSRNFLFQRIMGRWNSLTTDPTSRRHEFTKDQIDGLRASLRSLSDGDFDHLVAGLDPRGSTLVGLESLYVTSDQKRPGYHWCERSQRYKRYIRPDDDRQFMAGLMECLKYHFEPFALKDPKAGWNVSLIFELAPAVYRRPLYRKFGAFYGVKELNLNDAGSVGKQIDELLEDEGHDVVLHPVTEAISDRAEYHFVMADIALAFISAAGEMVIRGHWAKLRVQTVKEALLALIRPYQIFNFDSS